jgi:perosamine synthetase
MLIQTEPFINNDDIKIIKKVIKRKYVTEDKFTKEFEDKVKKYTGSKYAIAVNNWTSGIFCCLKAMNIGPGDEVIVPNITFIATSNAVIMAGATVVLCEVNDDNMCLDTDKIKSLINNKTKAVIPVHLYGNFCDMQELIKLKKKYKFSIIEDAAQAFGVRYKGKHVGNFGDCGGFSFYGNKILTTGEGGIIVTNSRTLAKKIYQIKNHGRNKKGIFYHKKIGFNFMFTELQAALGISQLNKFKKIIKKRQQIFKAYYQNINNKNLVKFHLRNKHIKPLHWFVNITSSKISKIQKSLKKENIQTRKIFYPLNLQPCYKNNKLIKNLNDNFIISKKIFQNVISLPTFHNIKLQQIKRVTKIINQNI